LTPLDVAPKSVEGFPVFSCLISTLLDDEEDGNYANRVFWVEYPPAVINQAAGKTVRMSFILGSREAGPKAQDIGVYDNIVRLAQCEMPDSHLALVLIRKKLREFGRGSWIAPRSGSTPSKITAIPQMPTTQSSWLHCNEWFVTEVCLISNGVVQWCYISDISCIDWEIVWDEPDYGGAGYPDSWQSVFPGEGCEPWELCVLGPEGGSYPVQTDPCDAVPPPMECPVNKCTSTAQNGIMLETQVQFASRRSWLLTNYEQYPNATVSDQSMRRETQFIIRKHKITGKIDWIPFQSNFVSETTPCRIVYKNADFEGYKQRLANDPDYEYLYWVHTHPFAVGEVQRVCDEERRIYKRLFSGDIADADKEMMYRIGLPGIIIDANYITFVNQNGTVIDQITACNHR
jgi:hypothetical protein